ncbi:hypothetical protein B296_00019104, partial [Ensete ventricosum]
EERMMHKQRDDDGGADERTGGALAGGVELLADGEPIGPRIIALVRQIQRRRR